MEGSEWLERWNEGVELPVATEKHVERVIVRSDGRAFLDAAGGAGG